MKALKWLAILPVLVFPLEFTKVPSLQSEGNGKWIIEFAINQYTDVEVSIVSLRDSTVVRHLAAGMLGANPPAPLTANALNQTIAWDGLGDLGALISTPSESLTVRVRAGMKVKYDNQAGNDPYTFGGYIRGMVGDTNGFVYVYGAVASTGGLSVRCYDKTGSYVRTVFPYSSSMATNDVSGFGIALQSDGKYGPRMGSTRATLRLSPLVIGGINFNHSGEFGSSTSMVGIDNNNELCFLGNVNTWMTSKTDGTRIGSAVQVPFIVSPALPANTMSPPNTNIGGVRYLCSSPDKKSYYLSGLWLMPTATTASDTGFWRDGQVLKVDKISGVATPLIQFTGVPKTQAARFSTIGGTADNFRYFSAVHGMACDDSGRLYICDRLHSRIGVYDTSGLYLGGIPLKWPEMVQINPKTGEVYALSRVVTGYYSGSIKIYKFGGWRNSPTAICSTLVTTELDNYGDAAYMVTVTAGTGAPTIWVAHSRMKEGVKLYRDDGTMFTLMKNFSSPNQKVVNGYDRLAVDRKTETVFINDGGSGIGRIANWSTPMVQACTLSNGNANIGNGVRLAGVDIAVSRDNQLYVQDGGACGGLLRRYTIGNYFAPAKWVTSDSNVLAGTVSRQALNLNGYRGMGISPTKKVAVFSRDPSNEFNQFIAELGDSGQNTHIQSGPYFFPAKLDTLVKFDRYLIAGGFKFDLQNNLYVGFSTRSKDHKRPTGYEGDDAYMKSVGSIIKVASGVKGAFIKTRGGCCNVDTLPEQNSTGYEKIYLHGLAPFSVHEMCWCRTPRFDVDDYGRLFIPNAITQKVAIIDNNGNEIVNFGEYGNLDDKGLDNKIPLCWPVGAAASDNFVYVTDMGNSRLVRAQMSYTIENIKLPTSSAINLSSGNSESAFSLGVSPNPFNPAVTFTLGNLRPAKGTTLKIYNATGKLIVDLTSKINNNKVVWNATAIPSGLYVAVLSSGKISLRQKIVYSK